MSSYQVYMMDKWRSGALKRDLKFSPVGVADDGAKQDLVLYRVYLMLYKAVGLGGLLRHIVCRQWGGE